LVEVENEKHVLNDATKGAMYYYDVYIGPVQMMEFPYGCFGNKDTVVIQNAIGGIKK